MNTVALIAAMAIPAGFLVGGLGFVGQCISRGFGSLKGFPLPRRWWETP